MLPFVVAVPIPVDYPRPPVMFDFAEECAGASVTALLLLTAIRFYGFHAAPTGRSALEGDLLEAGWGSIMQ